MLKEIIDDFYIRKQGSREQTRFYVSNAGKCPRQVFFAMKNYPRKPMEAQALRKIHHKDMVHSKLKNILYSLGIVKATEIEIPPQELISGRADAIIGMDGKEYVVELKSINSFGFEQLDRPKDGDVKQLTLYMHYFNIRQGLLVYENKNTQEMKEFEVDYDGALARSILDSFASLKQDVDSGRVPEKPHGLEQWQCDYCPYAEECGKV